MEILDTIAIIAGYIIGVCFCLLAILYIVGIIRAIIEKIRINIEDKQTSKFER